MPAGVTDPNYKPGPGRLGNLTVIQLHALEKFKKEVKDEGWFDEERMDDELMLRSVPISLLGSSFVVRQDFSAHDAGG